MSPRSAGIDTLLEVDTVVQYSCSNLVLILCNGIKLFGGEKILLRVGLLSLCFKFDRVSDILYMQNHLPNVNMLRF